MLFDLPTENEKKIEKKLKKSKYINTKSRGMFLEVDLNYPKKLHKLHRDFPLAPVRYNVTFKELSPLNELLYKSMKNNHLYNTFSEEKLIPIFHEKNIYLISNVYSFTYLKV